MEDSYLKKQKLKKVLITLLIMLIIGIIGYPIFAYFRISSEARFALREAKNVNIAFRAVITEYYGADSVIYDRTKSNGMADGVGEEIRALAGQSGSIKITDYDASLRKVTGFIYRTDKFEVTYSYDKTTGDAWKVHYLFKVLDYDE